LVLLDLQLSRFGLLTGHLRLLSDLDPDCLGLLGRVQARPVPVCLFLPAHVLG
jgi:hypothetical protein